MDTDAAEAVFCRLTRGIQGGDMSYKVKLDIFEGPFDLLVYLIERSGVDIYEVNISEITDQYMDYISAMEEVDSETAAEFMVLAATLLQIKSKMLLPEIHAGAAEQEDAEEEDPRRELADRIAEYRKYRAAAEELKSREARTAKIFTKPAEDISRYTEYPEEYLNVDLNQFIRAFQTFLEKRRRIGEIRKRYEYAARDRMSMEEKAEDIKKNLEKSGKIRFSCLSGDEDDIYDVVLTFVTLLELLSQGVITVVQEQIFGDMTIERRGGFGESWNDKR